MKITIVGLGGVGGYFGFKLAKTYRQSQQAQVHFVARGATYDLVQKRGLELISEEEKNSLVHPEKLWKDVAEVTESDVWLLCTKEYDLEQLCLQLKEKIKPQTVILPLMNGADIYERVRRMIPGGIVLPACVYVASHLKEKGIVEHKGNPGKIMMGKDPEHPEYVPMQVLDLFLQAGIDIQYKENAFGEIWTKYFFIASFGLLSARYNQPLGAICADPALRARAGAVMEEIKAIALKKNIDVPENIIELTFQKAASFPYATPTSLQLDVQNKKVHTELELFSGAIISYGRMLDIAVPETTQIDAEIKAGLLN